MGLGGPGTGVTISTKTYMGYLSPCSVQGHFGVMSMHLRLFRKDYFQNTPPPAVMIFYEFFFMEKLGHLSQSDL